MKKPTDLCLCGHTRAAHDPERVDHRCEWCGCDGFARSPYQPNTLRADGHRITKRGKRLGDKPGNLISRGPGSN